MSEKIKIRQEFNNSHESGKEHQQRLSRQVESRAESSRHEHQENLGEILTKIEKTAQSSQDLSEHQKPSPKAEQTGPRYVSGELRDNTLKRSLRRIQKDLRPYQRPFSKLMHIDAVEQISDVTAKTIARPEGLLFGGAATFITSLGVLLICRYYGYEYNYLLGLLSFPLGYILGVASKFATKPLRK